jgi:hypothetical protein
MDHYNYEGLVDEDEFLEASNQQQYNIGGYVYDNLNKEDEKDLFNTTNVQYPSENVQYSNLNENKLLEDEINSLAIVEMS